jgi:serine/threonine protein kinase/TPR repeat protein
VTVTAISPRPREAGTETTAEYVEAEIPSRADERQSGQEPASFAPGTRFGDYEIIKEIARGGMGVVFMARQVSLNRLVALKMILSARLASRDDVRRFRAEAEAAARLDHPGIVPIHEVGEQDGQHFFSMGLVEGGSLGKLAKDGPLAPKEAARLVRSIAEAVQYAHSRNIVHRDLKPANVLLDNYGNPKVTDFGLAKNIEADSSLTGTGQVMGTPSYMAPEQAAGRVAEVGPLADVYALGGILYYLLTGRPPFQAGHVAQTLRQVIEQEPLSPRQVNLAVDRDLETICLKCLQKHADVRYASAGQLADELACYLRGEAISARPISRTASLLRWCRRNPSIAILSGSLLVALLGGLLGTSVGLVRAEQRRRETVKERDDKDKALQVKSQAFNLAMGALRKLTDRVVELRMARQTELSEDDRRFLRDIQRQYEELAKLPGDDAEQRFARGEGHFSVGRMAQELGEIEETEAAYRKAVAIFEQLVADFPDRSDFRQWLALGQNNLGNVFKNTGRPKEAEEAHAAARTHYKQLAADFPTRSEFRMEVALSYYNLGILLHTTRRLQEAEKAHAEARALLQQLVADFPDNTEFRWKLGMSHHSMGFLLSEMDRLREAEESILAALAIQKELDANFPMNRLFRLDLALTYNNLGNLLKDTGRLQEAEEALTNALAIHKQLATNFPAISDYRNDLAGVLGDLAKLANVRRDYAQARRWLEEAEPHHQAALKANPKDPTFRQYYVNHFRTLTQSCAGDGDQDAALRSAGRLRDLGWDPPGETYDAAGALALCVAIVEKDSEPDLMNREKQMRFYSDEAMAMLRVAVSKGFADVALMKKDTELDSLRQRQDFQQLLADLEAKATADQK